MSVQTAASSLPVALDEICHDEQVVVWVSEIMGDLCEWLDFDDYEDKLDAVAALRGTVRSIVSTAIKAHSSECSRSSSPLSMRGETR